MKAENSSKLKALQTRKAKIKGQLPVLKKDMQEASSLYSKNLQILKDIEEEIDSMSKGDLEVSEHAVLRYIERVMQIDLEEIKQSIVEQVEPLHKSLRDGKYPISGGRVVVSGNVIVTVEA